MAEVVVRRLAQLVLILVGLSLLVFAWVRALPGDPADALLARSRPDGTLAATKEAVAEVRHLYGLNRPLYEQYVSWLDRVVRLDLGQSIVTHTNVSDELRRRFPATVELSLAALVVALGVGIPVGFLAARRARTWFDDISLAGASVVVSIPIFVLAFVVKYVFSIRLGWLPSSGRADVTATAVHPTGFYLVDAVVSLDGPAFMDVLRHLVLPGLALGLPIAAVVARVTRAAVLDVAHEDYVRTAAAKGLSSGAVARRHVLRNALVPVVTVAGLTAGALLEGAALVEVVFGWGGMGSLLFDAIGNRDYPVLQAGILFIAVVFVFVNLVCDIACTRLDPRASIT